MRNANITTFLLTIFIAINCVSGQARVREGSCSQLQGSPTDPVAALDAAENVSETIYKPTNFGRCIRLDCLKIFAFDGEHSGAHTMTKFETFSSSADRTGTVDGVDYLYYDDVPRLIVGFRDSDLNDYNDLDDSATVTNCRKHCKSAPWCGFFGVEPPTVPSLFERCSYWSLGQESLKDSYQYVCRFNATTTDGNVYEVQS
eukprot:Clim_evm20s208 gene=Clim_evmTU20s208